MITQPYSGSQMVILERRDAEGRLEFKGDQPPVAPMTFDNLYQMFFRDNPEGVGTWESLSAWLTGKGWSVRAKTW